MMEWAEALRALGANVMGHENTKNSPNDILYTRFLPDTSDTGPTNKWPTPSPRENRLMDRIVAVCEMLNSCAVPSSANNAW